jgi:hypothetical protein
MYFTLGVRKYSFGIFELYIKYLLLAEINLFFVCRQSHNFHIEITIENLLIMKQRFS